MAGLSNVSPAPNITMESHRRYHHALWNLKQALDDPLRAVSDETLTTVNLLSLYEPWVHQKARSRMLSIHITAPYLHATEANCSFRPGSSYVGLAIQPPPTGMGSSKVFSPGLSLGNFIQAGQPPSICQKRPNPCPSYHSSGCTRNRP
ncbi:hypothetical protein N7468_000901 [Penicillium chermesinum]|uniref:Uncharacterized protein n=1 Tax=Penicillium chermesinum TaxID=63820 RepID=A0A9W9TWU7_9EURO|nr:uncharacterized protein N7468_000901 [Penicillium chermesinum]KAJ5245918.1 hypothetical protein N7468_000901 [Penicillium chermesinum]